MFGLTEAELKSLLERGFRLERQSAAGEDRLVLIDCDHPKQLPLVVDFDSSAIRYRLRSVRSEPLARALGVKQWAEKRRLRVVDATAGLGTDALIAAALGCDVRAIERSHVTFALLEDGYSRLTKKQDKLSSELAARLQFFKSNAADFLKSLTTEQKPDVIYLDPMFPEESHSKSALPKKTMQVFRRLLDGDDDAELLFQTALDVAVKRVVVKRPPGAMPLGAKPSHQLEGKTARFDIYMVGMVGSGSTPER